MAVFVVSVNGQRACSVDLTTQNTRSVQVTWIGSTKVNESLFLSIGGMDDDEHVSWSVPPLQIGDEGTIKIVHDSPIMDPPASRKSAAEMDQWSRELGQSKGKKDDGSAL